MGASERAWAGVGTGRVDSRTALNSSLRLAAMWARRMGTQEALSLEGRDYVLIGQLVGKAALRLVQLPIFTTSLTEVIMKELAPS